MPTSSFLRLAAELRLEVYGYLLPTTLAIQDASDHTAYDIRLVCRQVKSEYDAEVVKDISAHVQHLLGKDRFIDVTEAPKITTFAETRHVQLNINFSSQWDVDVREHGFHRVAFIQDCHAHIRAVTFRVHCGDEATEPTDPLASRAKKDMYESGLMSAAEAISKSLPVRFMGRRVLPNEYTGLKMVELRWDNLLPKLETQKFVGAAFRRKYELAQYQTDCVTGISVQGLRRDGRKRPRVGEGMRWKMRYGRIAVREAPTISQWDTRLPGFADWGSNWGRKIDLITLPYPR
jgi:hypothetical protein